MIRDLTLSSSGAVLFGYLVVTLLFCRFWRQTRARLFAYFAVAFLILAMERAMILTVRVEPIHLPLLYCTRLVAFMVIAGAIWDANRAQR